MPKLELYIVSTRSYVNRLSDDSRTLRLDCQDFPFRLHFPARDHSTLSLQRSEVIYLIRSGWGERVHLRLWSDGLRQDFHNGRTKCNALIR